MRTVGDWDNLYQLIAGDGCNFVIFDVLTQIIDGDINDSPPVAKFFDGVRRFTRNEIPVLIITHSSEKRGASNQKSDKPLGHTSISGFVRWNIFLCRSASGEWTAKCFGKWADMSKVMFSALDFNVPRFKIFDQKNGDEIRSNARQRNSETMNKRADVAKWIADSCQGLNKRETQKAVSQKFNLRNEPNLSKPEWKALVDLQGATWTLKGPLST
jgi:hypothetical protein